MIYRNNAFNGIANVTGTSDSILPNTFHSSESSDKERTYRQALLNTFIRYYKHSIQNRLLLYFRI